MGDSLDKVVGLAGSTHVSGYTRHTQQGKSVEVSSYMRSPADMTDSELLDSFKNFWSASSPKDATYTQRTNHYKAISSEVRKRGLLNVVKGGRSQDNDPNHPSYEAKPTKKATAFPATQEKAAKIAALTDAQLGAEVAKWHGKEAETKDAGIRKIILQWQKLLHAEQENRTK